MKMRVFFGLISFLIAPTLAATSSNARADEEIHLWVATSVKANIFDKIREPFFKATGIKLIYPADTTKGSSDDYFIDVIQKKVEAATTSLGYEEWASNLKKKKIEVPKEVTYRVIGRDIMKVFAHPGVGVKKLTLEQLADLASGKTKNWKQVGGPDLPVKVIFAKTKTATIASFQKMVLKGQSFDSGALTQFESFETATQAVATTPGAFSFCPGPVDQGKNSLIETPAIGRPITLINLGKPSDRLLKLLEFIRAEGKNFGVNN